MYLDCTKYNEIYIYFCHGQKHVNYRIWNELHAWFIYRATQSISDMWVIHVGRVLTMEVEGGGKPPHAEIYFNIKL